ncbi:MAG: catechol 2,3-dioxygenase [Acidimicrobiaceae bacterium]|nr:catechol 2,3-dioxygenase [Acidimicrobiaceae bacterium]
MACHVVSRYMEIKELGHLVLYVHDVARSSAFYRDVLGWHQISPEGLPVAAFSSGRTHHELLLIEVGADAAPLPGGRHVGLYHFGLKIGDTDEDLRTALAALHSAGVRIAGAADHTVSHSLYIFDPDGNEIELYIDVAGIDWANNPESVLAPTRPLAL